tara:strand:- start:411 stop:1121 length:711 start_codon:yes stop_codon:yes gene_type:complete
MCSFVNAQTADEIIDNYFENIGGVDAFNALEGIQINAKANTQAGELPVTIIQMKDGKSILKFELQGKELVQMAFDGETAWAHNFMSMQAEKSDSETTENAKRQLADFPDALLNYKDKGYTVELMENETFEGTDCFKLKLTKLPQLVDGAEVENVVIYYFDTETFVPLGTESEIVTGPGKGMIAQTIFSDYQEVDGIYFPFSMTQGVKGMGGQAINVESIVLNPEIDDSIFAFPSEQ